MTTILVIEDDDEFRKMLTRMLTRSGYDVVEAPNGRVGMNAYHRNQIDLVITDVFMPEKEGIETVMDLKSENPDAKIIAISGGGTISRDNYLDNLLDFGVQKTFEKPFKTEAFLAAIAELLAEP